MLFRSAFPSEILPWFPPAFALTQNHNTHHTRFSTVCEAVFCREQCPAKTPPAVDQTAGGVSREKRGKKKSSSLPLSEAVLHLHGYYNAFPGKCKLYFVKYILTVSNYAFCYCAHCAVVNILCPSLDFLRNWSIV